MFLIDRECRYGYVFLDMSGKSSLEEKLEVVAIAINMHCEGVTESEIKSDCGEGRVVNTGMYDMIAPGYSGYRYEAELETDRGKVRLRFLIGEYDHKQEYSLN